MSGVRVLVGTHKGAFIPAIPVMGKYKGRFGNAFVNIAYSVASKLR